MVAYVEESAKAGQRASAAGPDWRHGTYSRDGSSRPHLDEGRNGGPSTSSTLWPSTAQALKSACWGAKANGKIDELKEPPGGPNAESGQLSKW